MKIPIFLIYSFVVIIFGCQPSPPTTNTHETSKRANAIAPAGFDVGLLKTMRCPENLAKLRLANPYELNALNERIKVGDVKDWDNKLITKPVDALLIRADNKIAYRFEQNVPILLIEEAVILDKTVGKPNPDKYRK
jgi:uncharacterized protein YbaR (Trm112 family)